MFNIDEYVIYKKKATHQHSNNQVVFKFPNDYGASLIQGRYTHGGDEGLFEIAVLTFTSDKDWEICYDTTITDDTLGYLTESEVYETLEQIYKLEPIKPLVSKQNN